MATHLWSHRACDSGRVRAPTPASGVRGRRSPVSRWRHRTNPSPTGPRAAGAIRGDPSPGACPASRGLWTRDPLLRSGPGPAPFEPASASLAGLLKAGAFIPVQGVCIPVPIVPCLPGDTESLGFSWRRSGEMQSGLASLSLQIKCLFKDASPDVARRACSPRSSWEPHPPPGQVPHAMSRNESCLLRGGRLCGRIIFCLYYKRASLRVFITDTQRERQGVLPSATPAVRRRRWCLH